MNAFFPIVRMALKFVVLFVVLLRFHGSWVGFSVVLLMAGLLFYFDLAVVRYFKTLLGVAR